MSDHEGAPPGQEPPPQEPEGLQFSTLTHEVLAQLFPKLEIGEAIAIGGMGAVYLARQPELDRKVALKVLPPELCSEEEYLERFRTEARAMAQLNHPTLVGVYDFGQTSGYFASDYFYFIMEYVEGSNLAELLAAHGKFGPEFSIPVLTNVCDGMAYAHKRGIVHLDLKPGNIMLDNEGMVKILDFGLAKLLDPATGGALEDMGTPDYSAPERFQPGTPIDHRADIYSMGVLLYEMLVGAPPRQGAPLASQAVAGLDPAIDAIIARCMSADPAARYPSAMEMKADLAEAEKKVQDQLLKSPNAAKLLLSGSGPQVAAAAKGFKRRLRSLKRARLMRKFALLLVLAVGLGLGAWWTGLVPDSLLSKLGLPSPPGKAAQELPPMFPELKKLHTTLQDQLELKVTAPRADSVKSLALKYGQALDRLEQDAQGSGEQALLAAIAEERKRFSQAKAAPGSSSQLPELAKVQTVLRTEMETIDAEAKSARGTLLKQYDRALSNLLAELERQDRAEDADRVKVERERVRKLQ